MADDFHPRRSTSRRRGRSQRRGRRHPSASHSSLWSQSSSSSRRPSALPSERTSERTSEQQSSSRRLSSPQSSPRQHPSQFPPRQRYSSRLNSSRSNPELSRRTSASRSRSLLAFPPPPRTASRSELGKFKLKRSDLKRSDLKSGLQRLTPAAPSTPSLTAPQPRYVPVAVMRSRLLMVWTILMVGIVGLTGNLVRLQVFEADKLQAMAQAQHGISLKPFIPSRPVVDRNGNTLAVDRQQYILYAHPIGFKDSSQEHKLDVAQQLAPILNQEPSAILDSLNLRDSGIKLKTGLTEDDAKRVRALLIDGLDLSPYQARFYPYGSLFAHIVGYTNLDREGQVGVEHSQSDLLSYTSPTLNLNRTAYGALMPEGVPEDFKYHEHLNLKLTVDNRLQRRIRTLLQEETRRLTAERSLAIVMEVETGAIRAMVTEPTYDPNGIHTTEDIPRMVNSVVSHLYEPGSTFKPINVAIALESGRLNPNDIIHDSGRIAMGTWSIGNHDFNTEGARGDLTVSDVMKYSSNIGMIRIMQKLDRDQYYDWLGNLGLGQLTGIDLPYEAPALVKSRQQFTESAVESATTAFGQGFSLTPLQLLQMQAAIGNGGQLVTPHVVDGLFDHDGRRYWTPERAVSQTVFSEDTTRIVLDMMETVVTDGTGRAAQVPGYRIAGKTGTAQKVGDRGVYEENVKVTSFVSLFPADEPKFVLLVLVDEPQGRDTYGGTVAAPIARNIIESVISLENLQP